MSSINLDRPLERPIDPLSALLVSNPKSDSPGRFDHHLERVRSRRQDDDTSRPPEPRPAPVHNAPPRSEQPAQRPNDDRPVHEDQATDEPRDEEASNSTASATANDPNAPQPAQASSAAANADDKPKPVKLAKANARAAKAFPLTQGKKNDNAGGQSTTTARNVKAQVEVETKTDVAVESTAVQSEATKKVLATSAQIEQTIETPISPDAVDRSSRDVAKPVHKVKAVADSQESKPLVAPVEAATTVQQAQANIAAAEKVVGTPAEENDLEPGKSKSSAASNKKPHAANTRDNSPEVAIAPVSIPDVKETQVASTDGAHDRVRGKRELATAVDPQQRNPSTPNTTDSSSSATTIGATTTQASPSDTADGRQVRGGERTSQPSGTREVDRVRFVQRVSRALQTAGEGNGSLRLRLSPPELGQVRLEVMIKDGTMSARLEAETPAAKAALLDSRVDLQARLKEMDITLDHFEVELSERSSMGGPTDQQTGNAYPDREFRQPTPRPKPRSESSTNEPAAGPHRIHSNDQLNIVV